MDLSSGIVRFGGTCPGGLMNHLREQNLGGVQGIKKLETSFYTWSGIGYSPYVLGCGDPSVMISFLEAIHALEDLYIHNRHRMDMLWPAILRHGHSLKRLAIHTPPDSQSYVDPAVWTADTVRTVAQNLTKLTTLEMDIDVDTGKAAMKNIAPGSILDEVAKMRHLQFLRVSVILSASESVFAPPRTRDSLGPLGSKHSTPGKTLARAIFNQFFHHNPDAELKELELRLCRTFIFDRGESVENMKYAIRAVKGQETRDDEQVPACSITEDSGWDRSGCDPEYAGETYYQVITPYLMEARQAGGNN